jgi:uncharacterized protein YjbJ (UPF0337 family)
MNWDRMEGVWKQRRGKAVHHWGTMMNDELAATAGKYEELVGKLQESYGIASEQSKRRVDDFRNVVRQLKKSNAMLVRLQAGHKSARPARRKTNAMTSTGKTRRSQIRG